MSQERGISLIGVTQTYTRDSKASSPLTNHPKTRLHERHLCERHPRRIVNLRHTHPNIALWTLSGPGGTAVGVSLTHLSL